MFLPFLFAGVVAVNALECFAYVSGWFPKAAVTDTESQPSIPDGSNWHWHKLRSVTKQIYEHGLYNSLSQQSSDKKSVQSDSNSNSKRKATIGGRALSLLWQFSPDLVVICAGVQLANTFNGLRNSDSTNQITVQLFSLPLTFLVLIIIGIMQYGNARLNISRFVFANPVMGLLGYCSFGIYLFQRIIIDWYMPEYVFGTPYSFPSSPLWQRFVIVLGVILFSWLVQRFVVDTLSVFLYKRMMKS